MCPYRPGILCQVRYPCRIGYMIFEFSTAQPSAATAIAAATASTTCSKTAAAAVAAPLAAPPLAVAVTPAAPLLAPTGEWKALTGRYYQFL